jgi:hypothetical protein
LRLNPREELLVAGRQALDDPATADHDERPTTGARRPRFSGVS